MLFDYYSATTIIVIALLVVALVYPALAYTYEVPCAISANLKKSLVCYKNKWLRFGRYQAAVGLPADFDGDIESKTCDTRITLTIQPLQDALSSFYFFADVLLLSFALMLLSLRTLLAGLALLVFFTTFS